MECKVESLCHNVDLAVGQTQTHVDLGVGFLEGGHMRRDITPPDPQRCRDKDRAARVLGCLGQRAFGVFDRFEDALRP